jgi:hypothetical protein
MDPTKNTPADAASMVADAKASGALKPIEDLMSEQGWDMDAGTALLLAQKPQAPGTQGKSPEELAQMMRDNPSVYEDLQALQPGGVLDKLGKETGTDSSRTSRDAAPPEHDDSDADLAEMGDYLKGSSSMKDVDPKSARDKMKKLGAKKPADLDKNASMKSDFMAGKF